MVLRHLVHAWLRSAAQEKVREKVVETAKEHVQAAAEEAEKVQTEPCHVGLVFALSIESGGLEDLLENKSSTRGREFVVRHGMLKGHRVALILAGAGREAAARATETLVAGHRPKWIFSAGLAGGLSPELKRHDILMVERVVDADGRRLSLDLNVDRAALTETPDVHVGTLLTVDEIVRLPEQKRALAEKHDAAAVDMETFAVADACRRLHVPFLAVRVVNDAVDDELPDDVEHLLAQKTTAARLGAAAGAVWRRPSSLKDMVGLRENAMRASERLAKFLAEMIGQL